MAMIEFEDRDQDSQRAILHYLETGKPPSAGGRGTALTLAVGMVSLLVMCLPALLTCCR